MMPLALLIARCTLGNWVAFPHPASPTGFFAPPLRGRLADCQGSKIKVEVLCGPSAGSHWVEKEDVSGSSFEQAMKSYAPLSDLELIVLADGLNGKEAGLLGDMAEDLHAPADAQGFEHPIFQAVGAALVAGMAMYFAKK